MATHDSSAPRYMPPIEVLNVEDFETASIRSAAPSYTSEAPSYHSTAPPHHETIPPYSPPAASRIDNSGPSSGSGSGSGSGSSSSSSSSTPYLYSAPPLIPSLSDPSSSSTGLPPIPPLQPRRHTDLPTLTAFRNIPSWSTMSSNPTARHYQRVAHRRTAAAAASSATGQSAAALQGIRRIVLDRIDEDERNRFRPLEDPYLVGEEAARAARQERMARENGDDVLVMEDRRWDGFLAELRGWEERERNGKQFRREMESVTSSRGGRIARRFGFR